MASVVLVDGQMVVLILVTFVQQASIPILSVPILRHIVLRVLSVLNQPIMALLVWHVAPASTPLQPGCRIARVVAPANTLLRPARPPRHNAKSVRWESITRTRARQNAYSAGKGHMRVQQVCQHVLTVGLENGLHQVKQHVPSAHLANIPLQPARFNATRALRVNMAVQLVRQHALSAAVAHIVPLTL